MQQRPVMLGESKRASQLLLAVALAGFTFIFYSARLGPLRFRFVISWVLGVVWIAAVKRVLGKATRARVSIGRDTLICRPHGFLGRTQSFPISQIRDVRELRLFEEDDRNGPTWALELSLFDGSVRTIGRWASRDPHAAIDAVRASLRGPDG